MKFSLLPLVLLLGPFASAENLANSGGGQPASTAICEKTQTEVKEAFLDVYTNASMSRASMVTTDKGVTCLLLGNLEGQVRHLLVKKTANTSMTAKQNDAQKVIWKKILQAGAVCGLKGRVPDEAQTFDQMLTLVHEIEVLARDIGQEGRR